MRYYEVEFAVFTQKETLQNVRDVVAALAGEAGFESFEDTDDGLKGYVQQGSFDQDVLDQTIQYFPMEGTHIIYKKTTSEVQDG